MAVDGNKVHSFGMLSEGRWGALTTRGRNRKLKIEAQKNKDVQDTIDQAWQDGCTWDELWDRIYILKQKTIYINKKYTETYSEITDTAVRDAIAYYIEQKGWDFKDK